MNEAPNIPVATTDNFLRGTVRRITFRNVETGFGVVRVEPEHLSGVLETIVGIVPVTIAPGMTFIARGEWQVHGKFGRQFRAASFTETEPTSSDAILRYLSSGGVKGFGPVLAKRVVDAFGEETIAILDSNPERLRGVPGIGEKKLQEILASWQEKRASRDVMLFFQNYGIPFSLAQRIYKAYKDRAIELVRENPYILCEEVWGIGFQTADRIAQSLGVDPHSSQRITAGLQSALRAASDDGHCFLPREQLLIRTTKLLGLERAEEVERIVSEQLSEQSIVEREGKYYLPLLDDAEQTLASNIAARLRQRSERFISPEVIQLACDQEVVAGAAKVIRYSPQQKDAIRLAATEPLVVITGGPGCGKTTVVRAIARLFREAELRVRLAAPTGRAAQRLGEVCGMEASTIHRLLRFEPQTKTFIHDEYTPLACDAIIVDESSMIDLSLATSLFRAIPPEAHIVIVGDADQLPSVGPGTVLSDLLALKEISRVELTNLFRRATESSITAVAHSINRGDVPHIPQPGEGERTEAYFIPASDAAEVNSIVERLVVDQIPKKFGIPSESITVLSPMNQGELGVIALNKRLQAKIVPSSADTGAPSVRVGDLEFRLGDRVCQRTNNYQLTDTGVFNGDQGRIVGIDAEAQSVFVELFFRREIEPVEYASDILHQLDLAYAISIHRSQGSEVSAIVLVLHDAHSIMLERQLIYTAVTRAKELLVIVGTKKALVLAVKKTRSRRRFSALVERIRSALA